MRAFRMLLASMLGIVVACSAAAPAQAYVPRPDSDAPRGASPNWLPSEQWVMERWLPFDEDQLLSVLGMEYDELWAAFSQTGRSIRQVAAGRGIPRRVLVSRLLASRRASVTPEQLTVLRARTERVLGQPHLGEHMLFHFFHTWSVVRGSSVLGRPDFMRLQGQGMTAGEIAASAGVAEQDLRRRALAATERYVRVGVERGATSAAQGAYASAKNRFMLDGWIGHSWKRSCRGCHCPPEPGAPPPPGC